MKLSLTLDYAASNMDGQYDLYPFLILPADTKYYMDFISITAYMARTEDRHLATLNWRSDTFIVAVETLKMFFYVCYMIDCGVVNLERSNTQPMFHNDVD